MPSLRSGQTPACSGRVPRADTGQVALQLGVLRRTGVFFPAAGGPSAPPGREIRPQRPLDLAWAFSRTPLRQRRLRLGACQMLGRMHPKTRRIGERYGCERAPIVRGCVVLVEAGKLPRQTRKPKKLWLWWSGQSEADLDLLWRSYWRRFDLEHTIRFLKQTLGWTTPRVRHPEQADRWTWL